MTKLSIYRTLALVITCTTASIANAALTTTLSNPDFQDPVGGGFNNVVPGWSEYSGHADGAGVWGSQQAPGFPTFPGGQSGSLIFTATSQDAWLFQSLGTVDASDVGKTLTLGADFGGRVFTDRSGTVDMTVAFRSGTTTGGTLGSILGTSDTQLLDSDQTNYPTLVPFATQTASFTPTAGDIGTVVFAVLDMDPQSMSGAAGQRQFVVDTVTLSAAAAIPEPSAIVLALFGLVGLGLTRRRRNR